MLESLLALVGEYQWEGLRYGWLAGLLGLASIYLLLKFLAGRRWSLPLAMPAGSDGFKPGRFSVVTAALPPLLRLTGLALLMLALFRPQSVLSNSETSIQTIDIFLALDVSGSMQAQDLRPNRLEAAKATLTKFVSGLKGDRVGLVVFAGRAFTQCPLSVDHAVVKHFINQVDLNSTVRLDGTAVGDGLLMSVQRLVREPKRDQVVILATDGTSNTGQDPLLAAKIAAQAGIRVYTIGIGQKGGAPQMAPTFGGKLVQVGRWEEPDEKTLTAIAQATGGRYFRAADTGALDQVYAQIANLERREVKVRSYREVDEHYWGFLWLGALLLGAEALLRLRIRTVY